MKHELKFSWLDLAKKLQSIAQAGLEYSENKYDIERYQQIRQISVEIVENHTNLEKEFITDNFASESGYQTPKVDVRGVVFRDNKILMVKETIDHCWSIPGGWADIGLSPFEVAKKEVWEESGLEVNPIKLLALFDKKFYTHPPDLFHVYKLFILCEETGGKLIHGLETSEVDFFDLENLPVLSKNRITEEQIRLMYEFKDNIKKDVICD